MLTWEEMRSLRPAEKRWGLQLDYASAAGDTSGRPEQEELLRLERERLKEELSPFIREQVKRVLKEEREYYKSRPSQAAKYYGGIFSRSAVENSYTEVISRQVYTELETRLRREWVRKGRG